MRKKVPKGQKNFTIKQKYPQIIHKNFHIYEKKFPVNAMQQKSKLHIIRNSFQKTIIVVFEINKTAIMLQPIGYN